MMSGDHQRWKGQKKMTIGTERLSELDTLSTTGFARNLYPYDVQSPVSQIDRT